MNTLPWRKLFFGLMMVCSIASLTVHGADGARGPLKIVLDDNYPPFSFRGADGKLQGLVVDQWMLWEKKSGIRVELHGMNWSEALQRMDQGQYDVIDTIFETPERKHKYEFTNSYASLKVCAYYHRGIQGISDLHSLKGFPVAVKSSDASIGLLRQAGIDTLIEYPSYEALIKAAAEHKISVFIVDKPPAHYFMSKYGIEDEFFETEPLAEGQFHRAVRKGDSETLSLVNKGFSDISETEMVSIKKKWLGSSSISQRTLHTLKMVGAAISGLLILLLLWILLLRRTIKRRMSELLASEARCRALFEAIPDLVFLLDAKGTYLDFHAPDPAKLAVPPEQFLCKTVSEVLPREVAEQLMGAIQLALSTGSISSLEYSLNTPVGSLYFDARIVPFGDGKVLATIRDVSISKDSERQLHESEVRYRTLFDQAPHAIYLIDPENGSFMNWNKQGARVLGYSDDEMKVLHVADIEENEDPAAVASRIANVLKNGLDIFVSKHRTKQGEVRDVLISLHHVTINGKRLLQSICTDITEQKKAEESLRIKDMAIAASLNGLALSDLEGKLTYVNPSFLKIWGYEEEEEVLGRLVPDFWQYGEQALEVIKSINDHGCWFGTLSARRKNGELMEVELTASMVKDADGVPVCMMGSFIDITARKQAERDLYRLNEELEDRVRKRTIELEEANRELESFCYSVSHDLRAPLRSINGLSQILLEDCSKILPPDAAGYLSRIARSASVMGTLIDGLLNLSRVSRAEMDYRQIDLSEIAVEIIGELQREEPARRVDITIADHVEGWGDPVLVRAMLQNLLLNAWKFTSRSESPSIAFGTIAQGTEIVYFVSDNGVGFNMAYSNKLFAPFHRLHGHDEFDGTGIGLATVARVIGRHCGRIWAESAEGAGATFYFTLGLRL